MNVTNQFLLVTDLDNTLVGDDLATKQLNQYLCTHRQNYVLVYATGRSYNSAQQLMQERQLIEPNYWVTGVGTEIYTQDNLDLTWASKISIDWQREEIASLIVDRFSELKPQRVAEQNPWKLSFHLLNAPNHLIPKSQSASNIIPSTKSNSDPLILEKCDRFVDVIIDQLVSSLQRLGLSAQVIFSSNIDVDILPRDANKGNAVKYIQQKLGITADRTLVCGDSGNDISMFQQIAFGVIVNNAQPELIQWYQVHANDHHYLANNSYASGILEALQRFNLLLK